MRVLALDVGTSSVRARLYDERARPAGDTARLPYEPTLDELDADELVQACETVLEEAREGGEPLATSCFWHSLLLLDTDYRPLTPVLLWSDRRAVAQAEELADRLDVAAVHARTGAVIHPSYWPAKLAWLRKEGAFEKARHAVSFGDYVLLRLTGELRTSLCMASGTGLLDLGARAWDVELLETLSLDPDLLPPIDDGPVDAVFPPLGDGACANLGAGCTTADRAALTIGTSGAYRVLREGEPQPRDGLFSYLLDEKRLVEGGAVNDGGNLRAWLERTLRLENAELREPDAHGLTFLPLFGGERSPGWNPRAAGAIAGLTFDVDADDLFQAALEGVAYGFAEIAERLPRVREVVATGQALLSEPAWIQLCADVLGRPVTAGVEEASLRGAAVYVLERLGEEPEPAPLAKTYEPDRRRTEIYAAARGRQRELYERLGG
jgi:gluconokinase